MALKRKECLLLARLLLFLFGVASDLSVKLAPLSSVVNWSVLISSRPRFLGIGVELIVVALMTFDFFLALRIKFRQIFSNCVSLT